MLGQIERARRIEPILVLTHERPVKPHITSRTSRPAVGQCYGTIPPLGWRIEAGPMPADPAEVAGVPAGVHEDKTGIRPPSRRLKAIQLLIPASWNPKLRIVSRVRRKLGHVSRGRRRVGELPLAVE